MAALIAMGGYHTRLWTAERAMPRFLRSSSRKALAGNRTFV
jgi:hypothetical protein